MMIFFFIYVFIYFFFHFIHDILHVSMPFSQIFPPSPSPTESIRLFYTSVSVLLSRTQGYCYHLSKLHIYALVYCIGVFSFWLTSLCIIGSSFIHLITTFIFNERNHTLKEMVLCLTCMCLCVCECVPKNST